MSSFVIPSQIQKGFESQADADPVIAKTINIIVSWKLVSIPQRFFNLFIFIYNDYKYKKFILGVRDQKVFVYRYFGNKPCNYKLNNLLHIHNQH